MLAYTKELIQIIEGQCSETENTIWNMKRAIFFLNGPKMLFVFQ